MQSSPPLIIRGLSTISALGRSSYEAAIVPSLDRAPAARAPFGERRAIFPFASAVEVDLGLISRNPRYDRLDRVTYAALAAVGETLKVANSNRTEIGCFSIGSSRGPTSSIEATFEAHLHEDGRVPVFTSPCTTAGNISSWVAQEYLARVEQKVSIASITTSMTCSSAFHSLLVAKGFVGSGMCRAAVFGGAEACLTPYTVAQLEALRIYTSATDSWPCRPCAAGEDVRSSVALGEGAGTAILQFCDGVAVRGDLEVLGLGWSMEEIPSATGISADGAAFEQSMRMAAGQLRPGVQVDCVVAHAPGTRRGDEAELQAISRVLGGVGVVSTKHLTGHTYAASGMLSLALAQALLSGESWKGLPYPAQIPAIWRGLPRAIAINTAGFGGNSITLIVGLRDAGS